MCIHGVQCKILEVLMRLAMYLMLLLTLYLGGCAVLDVSSMETAVPLSPGKFELSNYVSRGLDLSSAVVLNDINNSQVPSHDANNSAVGSSLAGYKLNIGVTKKLELGGRYYWDGIGGSDFSTKSSGYRLGAKYLLWHKKSLYFAVMPSINVMKGEMHSNDDWSFYKVTADKEDAYYNSFGYEAQFIGTFAPCPYISFTAVQKFSHNNYNEKYNGHSYPSQGINQWGTVVNMKVGYKPIFLIFEAGMENVSVVNGADTYLETVAVGVGIRSWDSKKKK